MSLSRRFRHRRDDWVVHGQLHRMTSFTCAACGLITPEPAARVGAIAVCPGCGGSSVVESEGQTRRATGEDTAALSESDLQQLRTARGRIARADRRQR